ncbi:uncharacterized protein LOC108604182 [Drosophila busckii]|uniref:uncharacterized protein LOC108604182 n=1 Tax=Drosophila busckii TaxID=30019 RepID=UPI00083EFBE7|nr:uncharacterized protein LOC108604182 [Drosophila busckii]
MTNVVCDSFNKSWVAYKECRLRAVSRNKTTLTALVYVKQPAYNIHIGFKMLKRANGYKPWLIDFKIDACKFLRTRYQPVAKIIMNLIKDVSTLNHSCPYKGVNGIKDFYNIAGLPVVLPTGDYLLELTWIFDMKPQFITNVYFTFIE